MPLIRYTGLQPRPETPFTGTGLVWYPGESRQIEDGTRARQLLNAGFGWEFLKDSDVAGPFVASKVASMDALVSEDRITTWANRAALVALGLTSAFFTDIGVGGSYWDYVGGRWRPSARRVTLKNLITAISNSAAPKVVLDYCTLPAGIWQDGDILEIDALKTREGGTSDTDATDLMIGTAPTTLGTSTGFSSSALATTTIQYVMRHRLRRESATSIRTLATAGGGGGLGTLTSLTTLTTGLSSLDTTEQYLQITSDLTTAGGEVAWLRGFTVTLVSGA